MSPEEETGPKPALGPPDWPSQVADRIESTVDFVRHRAVRPATTVARAAVYGILAMVLTAAVVVLLTIGIVRLLDDYAFPGRIWATYALVGGIFVLAGALLWARRSSRS